MARLALLQGQEPASIGLSVPPGATSDPGFVYNQARYYRKTGQAARGVQLLATRGPFAHLPHDAEDLVTEMLILARTGDARSAQRIAASVDDLFAPDADISGMSYKLRDDYTSLMWLGGTKALWDLGDGNAAAPLFYRYGNAARTPQTRSKGFYWAGLASARAGRQADAQRYFEMAAQYPEYFYGQLALERLGRPLPAFAQVVLVQPTAAQRAAFQQNRLVQAIRATARNGTDWRTERYFFTALADTAQDAAQMQLVAELAEDHAEVAAAGGAGEVGDEQVVLLALGLVGDLAVEAHAGLPVGPAGDLAHGLSERPGIEGRAGLGRGRPLGHVVEIGDRPAQAFGRKLAVEMIGIDGGQFEIAACLALVAGAGRGTAGPVEAFRAGLRGLGRGAVAIEERCGAASIAEIPIGLGPAEPH
jgi:soluble lytic murein transglycosylase